MRVEVSDTGIELSEPRNLSHFATLEMVTIPLAKTFGSSGLGLGIVHRAVALVASLNLVNFWQRYDLVRHSPTSSL
jgi:hypothetical protein